MNPLLLWLGSGETDTETARDTLGTSGTVASGRMSLTFATELLRRYFRLKIPCPFLEDDRCVAYAVDGNGRC